MKKFSLIFSGLLFFWITSSMAEKLPSAPISLNQSQQLVVVTTKDWDSTPGELQTFERDNINAPWKSVGVPISVVVGKNGLGWGVPLQKTNLPGPVKKEGDNRAPAGIFTFGTAFGFSPTSDHFKLNYHPLLTTTYCVDDTNSKYYNQIIDSSKVSKSDWDSGEQMRTVPGYLWGVVINYNTPLPVRGSGSCIFMHIWKGPNQGTAGCTAMPQKDVERILQWLVPDKNPLFVILPVKEYQALQSAWALPPLRHLTR